MTINRQTVLHLGPHGRIVAIDTAYHVNAGNRGRDVVVNSSYCGLLPARFLAEHRPRAVVSIDCGVGPQGAAIAGLWYLEALNIPAATVDVMTVHLGDGVEMYERGVISFCNRPAADCGVGKGMSAREASHLMLERDLGNATAYWSKAKVYERQGKYEAALEHYRKAHELSQHTRASHHSSEMGTRTASAVSVGEVQTRTHMEGESQDHFESSSREFANPNQCHAITFYFYRINKTQIVRLKIESITRRVIDPAADTKVTNNSFVSRGAIGTIASNVLATAKDRLEIEQRGNGSERIGGGDVRPLGRAHGRELHIELARVAGVSARDCHAAFCAC